jgi:hypothetical protein
MGKVAVTLVNPHDEDRVVGTLTAPALSATTAELDDMSANAYGFLVAGVVLIPEGVTLEDFNVLARDDDDELEWEE